MLYTGFTQTQLPENVVVLPKTLNRIRILFQLLNYNVLGFFRSHGMMHNNNSLRLLDLKDSHPVSVAFSLETDQA